MIWVLVGASGELEKTAKLDAWVKLEMPHGSFSKRDKGVGALVPSPTTTPELAETTPSNPRMTPARAPKVMPRFFHSQSLPAGVSQSSSFFLQLITGSYCRSILRRLCLFQRSLLYTCTADKRQSATAGANKG